MIKLIATRAGTILGATIVGHRAGEAIMEIVIAMQHKLKVSDLASIIHPYPTYNSGIQLLATEMAIEHSMTGFSGTLIRAIATHAWLTIFTMCESSASAPTRSSRITKLPVPFTVPPVSRYFYITDHQADIIRNLDLNCSTAIGYEAVIVRL